MFFWMEVYQRLSEFAHTSTQMEKFGPGLFWCITFFFKLFDVCLCNVLVLCYYFFFIPYHYFSRQKVLTQWAQPSLHYPRSYHHLFFIGTYSMFACVSKVCQEYVFLFFFFFFFFFFNFHMIFF